MWFVRYLWLLLCYSQYGRGNLLEDYEEITQNMLSPPEDKYSKALPIEIGKDKDSGCICRATKSRKTIVCFGNYECKKFPKLNWRCENFMLRTTVIQEIRVGELDSLYFLKDLKLEANHQLHYIQPGVFRNLTRLQHLTISYQIFLETLDEELFRGLYNLRELKLINNGFTNIVEVMAALTPSTLPLLKLLDLSKNSLEEIPENSFSAMKGTKLQRLDINLCGIDFIHPRSFLPLQRLKHLGIGSNDINSSIIIDFLLELTNNNINLTYIDLSDLGFRKKMPRDLLDVIANTTIEKLILSNNQFEVIPNDAFPKMPNIELVDLRKVSALSIGSETFEPKKFPNLRILFLGGNNLPGIHFKHLSSQQVKLLDLSSNKGPPSTPMYYEIDRDAFVKCGELEILNLSFNRIKSVFDYTFIGLSKLRILNLENGTIYRIGPGSFKPMKHLETLNLANNPITAHSNLSSKTFDGLTELKTLILRNCDLKRLDDHDNIFETLSNLTYLSLRNNQLYYITERLLMPLKSLEILDLGENLLVSWWKPLFIASGIRPLKVTGEYLLLRTTVIQEIQLGALDAYYELKSLKIEANHQLKSLQIGIFRNLTHLKMLSISYNSNLLSLRENVFEGLKNLKELVLVNNGFYDIMTIALAMRPSILPVLKKLDLSENGFETIPEDAFSCMYGSLLERLDFNLCRLDFIHPNSFLPLKMLSQLNIGQNDLNPAMIGDFIINLKNANINLTDVDLSGMGFRKSPPRHLMEIIANTTIRKLILADNQFEIIPNDAFPRMVNIEMIDLRRVSALTIGSRVFEPAKFPNLRILLLGGNNLPGLHLKNVSDEQVVIVDLSYNKGNTATPIYYEIDKGAFVRSRDLKVLNLAYNIIKSIFEYTFTGLNKLRVLNLENATIYFIGPGTFKPLQHLEILNLANNPLTVNGNLTIPMFEGLNELKILILKNCGIKHLYEDENIFEAMPNITRLILSNNQLYYMSPKILEPLKFLIVLDLSDNLLVSWWEPLFITADIRPTQLYLTNNKISQFTLSMVQDIDFLLKNPENYSVEIDLMDNVFVCDCISMYQSYLWLQTNGSNLLRQYFHNSDLLCSSPDVWEDRRVADFLSSIKRLRCLMNEKITSMMVLVWTAPTIVSIIVVSLIIGALYKYRFYIRYWLFLARIALGRKFLYGHAGAKQEVLQGISYKYDAFVSYCNEDREFVSEMVSQLELNPPFLKLCVYERDFEIGSFISESILASINSSKYIILIVSRYFAKSQWCRWETQLAEYHRLFLEDGTAYDPLVLIRLDEVDTKSLTTTLRFLLATKIYLSWNEHQPEEFWKKLRNVLIKNR